MKIESIKLKNFKAFNDTEMQDVPRFCVLVGANGSGKSTLFQVFAFLKEALVSNVHTALIKLGGSNGFREVRSRNSEGNIEIEVKFRERIDSPLVTYFLSIGERDGYPFVEREILKYRRGSSGQPWHFLNFSKGKGHAVTNELDEVTDVSELKREEQKLKAQDILAVKGLAQFERFPAVMALGNLIENWHVSDFHINRARPEQEAGYAEHLSREGENLSLVTEFLYNRHKDLFNKNEAEVKGLPLSMIWDQSQCKDLVVQSVGCMQQIECKIKNLLRYLCVSKSAFYDQNNNENTILVIRDLTEQKSLEAQIQRTERLIAMGELASGVAHEIRNPLNTIGTIIQQLDKDFEPKCKSAEYHQLARLVYKEVRRINETVQDFLRFARPEPIQPQLFQLSDLINNLFRQYQSLLTKQQLQFTLDLTWDGEVSWDHRQMHQVLINLIQNALDVLSAHGKISIRVVDINEKELEIRVHDTGPGIPADIRSKIFNLYFTTKAKGTGVGLSIVQRIVYEHGGIISVESAENRGTTFILRMPKKLMSHRGNC